MDPGKLSQLNEKMWISDKSMPTIKLDIPLHHIRPKKLKKCIVSKILTTKPVNREGFIQNMTSIWHTKGEKCIESLGDNCFIFHFNWEEDKRRILIRGPWHYDNALIVMEEPRGLGVLPDLKFDKSTFWVQFHNIPIVCMTKETALFLGKKVGKVKEIDLGKNGDCLRKFIRGRVEVDVSKPLERGIFLDVRGKEPVLIYTMYKRLPHYCWDCGLLGHTKKECPEVDPEEDYDPNRGARYVDWLQAPSQIRPRKNSEQNPPHTQAAEPEKDQNLIESQEVTAPSQTSANQERDSVAASQFPTKDPIRSLSQNSPKRNTE